MRSVLVTGFVALLLIAYWSMIDSAEIYDGILVGFLVGGWFAFLSRENSGYSFTNNVYCLCIVGGIIVFAILALLLGELGVDSEKNYFTERAYLLPITATVYGTVSLVVNVVYGKPTLNK